MTGYVWLDDHGPRGDEDELLGPALLTAGPRHREAVVLAVEHRVAAAALGQVLAAALGRLRPSPPPPLGALPSRGLVPLVWRAGGGLEVGEGLGGGGGGVAGGVDEDAGGDGGPAEAQLRHGARGRGRVPCVAVQQRGLLVRVEAGAVAGAQAVTVHARGPANTADIRESHMKLVKAPVWAGICLDDGVLAVLGLRVQGPELRVPVQEVGGGGEGCGLAVVGDLGEHVA